MAPSSSDTTHDAPPPSTPNVKRRLKTWTQEHIGTRVGFADPLATTPEDELREGIRILSEKLPSVETAELERAVEVARVADVYYDVAKGDTPDTDLPVTLADDEKLSLVAEREKLFSQRGMLVVICTVSLAAFLQGHVQSSINAGSLFANNVGIDRDESNEAGANWKLGAMNASPFLAAAFPGAPLSLPVNYCVGRRGALGLSAVLIIASSLGSALAKTWVQVLGARIVGGVGMGIKAVSAPILASETAVGHWRGSTILAWQLWVACGIMIGFVVNLIIAAAAQTLNSKPEDDKSDHRRLTFQLILGAPLVPALFLALAVCFCYESPRFYMRPNTPNYDLALALKILEKVRETRLQALRDLFLIWWSNREPTSHDDAADTDETTPQSSELDAGLSYAARARVVLKLSAEQYKTLFKKRRLRNAIWSTCTVALAQQLCGINVFAFYSNELFSQYGVERSMIYSFGFGAVNFFFGLFAMRSIDVAGRRRWLLLTLPLMALFLMAAAIAFPVDDINTPVINTRVIVGVVFIYLFAAAYSPGLGPIPFTLASESFPLSHREAGASVAISINLLFAGLLTILLPTINTSFKTPGTLGFFSGLNIIAFILVYFLVEETKQLTLEELDLVYDNPKSMFAGYQLKYNMPYYFKRCFHRKDNVEEPQTYESYAMQNKNNP
ncbi:hypothetical protein AK830_g5433 [Neonectria ditissima]|uniref:Major facilitator superfamily (MFS) profile domain-containing protein n=1 Tax=Neonectria ditissima TaxID=78410 RepID=A0A0P7BLV7_9HYPO|nr:hypothetical protein AK830_g5433 [Neonectria ditissima]